MINEGKNQPKNKKHIFRRALRMMFVNFFDHNVSKNAAALAYHLLFALFPLLIFISNLLGLLDLNVFAITQNLQEFLPKDVVGIIETYLDHVSHSSNHLLMWFSLIFSIWFPLRAVQGLMDDVRRAYGLGRPKRLGMYIVRQVAYTIVFLIVIVLTLLLSFAGGRVLGYINQILSEESWQISDYLLRLWQYLRFLPVALLMVVAIGTLYSASLDRRQPVKTVMPGLITALLLWLIVSMGFSFYVESFAFYSAIYGTLGAVIVLLIWLYMTAVILILGAELNATLSALRNEGSTNE